jgi:hypothetical protein
METIKTKWLPIGSHLLKLETYKPGDYNKNMKFNPNDNIFYSFLMCVNEEYRTYKENDINRILTLNNFRENLSLLNSKYKTDSSEELFSLLAETFDINIVVLDGEFRLLRAYIKGVDNGYILIESSSENYNPLYVVSDKTEHAMLYLHYDFDITTSFQNIEGSENRESQKIDTGFHFKNSHIFEYKV